MTASGINRIRRLCSERRYPEALGAIKEAESHGCVSAEMLVRKAMCLQLLNDSGSLEEVDQAFKAALELAPDSIQALIEYGWFRLNVMDDASSARELFQEALKLQRSLNCEVLTGLLKCEQELSPGADIERSLSELWQSLADLSEIRERVR